MVTALTVRAPVSTPSHTGPVDTTGGAGTDSDTILYGATWTLSPSSFTSTGPALDSLEGESVPVAVLLVGLGRDGVVTGGGGTVVRVASSHVHSRLFLPGDAVVFLWGGVAVVEVAGGGILVSGSATLVVLVIFGGSGVVSVQAPLSDLIILVSIVTSQFITLSSSVVAGQLLVLVGSVVSSQVVIVIVVSRRGKVAVRNGPHWVLRCLVVVAVISVVAMLSVVAMVAITSSPSGAKPPGTSSLSLARIVVVSPAVMVVTGSTSTQQRSLRQRVSGGEAQTKQTQKNLKDVKLSLNCWKG